MERERERRCGQAASRVIGAVRGSVLDVPPIARATPRIPSAVPFAGFDRPVLDEITNVHSPLRLFRPPRDTFHVLHVTQFSVQVLFLGLAARVSRVRELCRTRGGQR